jgi:hydrogenase-4 component F
VLFQADPGRPEDEPDPPLARSSSLMTLTVAPTKAPVRLEPSWWMVAPVVAGVIVLVVLGVHPPAPLVDLLARGATELQGGSR